MKILERKEWSHKFKCSGCGSTLLCERGDVKYGVSGMDAEGGYYCECVVCKEQYALGPRAKVPSDALSDARDAFEVRNPRRR